MNEGEIRRKIHYVQGDVVEEDGCELIDTIEMKVDRRGQANNVHRPGELHSRTCHQAQPGNENRTDKPWTVLVLIFCTPRLGSGWDHRSGLRECNHPDSSRIWHQSRAPIDSRHWSGRGLVSRSGRLNISVGFQWCQSRFTEPPGPFANMLSSCISHISYIIV